MYLITLICKVNTDLAISYANNKMSKAYSDHHVILQTEEVIPSPPEINGLKCISLFPAYVETK